MDRALYLAMSGAKQDMQSLQLRANNLANASTTGFRADLAQARSMQAYGEGLPSRVFALSESPAQNWAQGATITTGRDLDVMVEGQGFLSVLDQQGQEAYTRAGQLRVDATGLLQTQQGQFVLGENGNPIALPLPVSNIQISKQGDISVLPQGAPPNGTVVIDRLKLVSPSQEAVFKDTDGLLKPNQAGLVFNADPNIRVLSGALEGSNVNPIEEMTHLIELQRHFETQVKLMKTAEEMDKSSASLLSLN